MSNQMREAAPTRDEEDTDHSLSWKLIFLEILTLASNIVLASYVYEYFEGPDQSRRILMPLEPIKNALAIITIAVNMTLSHWVFKPAMTQLRQTSKLNAVLMLAVAAISATPDCINTFDNFDSRLPLIGGDQSAIFRPVATALCLLSVACQSVVGLEQLHTLWSQRSENASGLKKILLHDSAKHPIASLLAFALMINALSFTTVYCVNAMLHALTKGPLSSRILLGFATAIGSSLKSALFTMFAWKSFVLMQNLHQHVTDVFQGEKSGAEIASGLMALLLLPITGFVFADQPMILLEQYFPHIDVSESTYKLLDSLGLLANIMLMYLPVYRCLQAGIKVMSKQGVVTVSACSSALWQSSLGSNMSRRDSYGTFDVEPVWPGGTHPEATQVLEQPFCGGQ